MATTRAAAKPSLALRRLHLTLRTHGPLRAAVSCRSHQPPSAPAAYRLFHSSLSTCTTTCSWSTCTVNKHGGIESSNRGTFSFSPSRNIIPAQLISRSSFATVSENAHERKAFSTTTALTKVPVYTGSSERDVARADAKLIALSEAKARFAEAKCAYNAAVEYSSKSGEDDTGEDEAIESMRSVLLNSERELSVAYRQAIKYVARTRQVGAASAAEGLLEEMIDRCGAPPTEHPLEGEGDATSAESTKLKVEVMAKMLDETAPSPPVIAFPPPGRKDFLNVLHSWASSKSYRKGLHAETLLLRMAELSWWYPDTFDTLPDSRTFALVVKCHAGSTHRQALKKILHLHDIHGIYADHGIPGIFRRDPFVLIASIKALKRYWKAEEAELAELWFSQLHAFVMDPANNHYCVGVANKNDAEANETAHAGFGSKDKVDMTGTYTTVIRQFARLRGQKGAAAKCRNVLDKMQKLAKNSTAAIATIEVKTNAFNLVLGAFRDSHEERYAIEAISLLTQMIDEWEDRDEEVTTSTLRTVPFPTEQSFDYCMQSLANMKDADVMYKESQRLLKKLESMYGKTWDEIDGSTTTFYPSTKVYNSLLEVYAKCIRNDDHLLSMTSEVIDKMNQLSEQYPNVKPDVKTWSFVLRACSTVGADDDNKMRALEMALATFKRLEENESNLGILGDKPSLSSRMTDKCYFHMMKCVRNLVFDKEEKRDRIIELFADACKKGLVSADVLKVFRHQVSEEFFLKKVGSGRLADNWIANVTSGKALYTDGTMGGAGKNARRKGKSTSNWAKKERKKEEEMRLRKEAKTQKKLLRKLKREEVSKKGRKASFSPRRWN